MTVCAVIKITTTLTINGLLMGIKWEKLSQF